MPERLQRQIAELGANLRARRKDLELSAVVVSEAAGISRVTLHRIERGEPSVTMGAYQAVADALGCEIEVLDPIQFRRAAGYAAREAWIPVRIALEDYPCLAELAWQLAPGGELTPREALDIYERNWRHLDPDALSTNERMLIENLRKAIGRDPGDV
ncbi:MAG: helix-turn-helix domain-containing protein [Xanthomonadales bacterium]|nr:helix-turn-helix domain-containing protein [Xanthomonadales bacterium]